MKVAENFFGDLPMIKVLGRNDQIIERAVIGLLLKKKIGPAEGTDVMGADVFLCIFFRQTFGHGTFYAAILFVNEQNPQNFSYLSRNKRSEKAVEQILVGRTEFVGQQQAKHVDGFLSLKGELVENRCLRIEHLS